MMVRILKSSPSPALVMAVYLRSSLFFAETHKFGILEVDGTGLVTSFLEKPSPDSTSSRMAVRSLISSMPLIYY